jgi:hypothetical protein
MSAEQTESCAAGCGYPVHLTEPHIAINRNVERFTAGAFDVLESVTIAYMHVACGERIDTAAGEAPALQTSLAPPG